MFNQSQFEKYIIGSSKHSEVICNYDFNEEVRRIQHSERFKSAPSKRHFFSHAFNCKKFGPYFSLRSLLSSDVWSFLHQLIFVEVSGTAEVLLWLLIIMKQFLFKTYRYEMWNKISLIKADRSMQMLRCTQFSFFLLRQVTLATSLLD